VTLAIAKVKAAIFNQFIGSILTGTLLRTRDLVGALAPVTTVSVVLVITGAVTIVIVQDDRRADD
jgi:hypothetical protein